jgi:hypothetical protein
MIGHVLAFISIIPNLRQRLSYDFKNTTMYGYGGYGTSAYGSKRQSLIPPVIKHAMTVLRNTYNVGITLMLRFKTITLGL